MLGTVARLRRYPVKSMLGEDLDASAVSHHGLASDRRLAVVSNATGKVASAKYPRLWRDLLTLSAVAVDDTADAVRIKAHAERYRPNLVIRTTVPGFTENAWLGCTLRVGDELILGVIARTPRCAVPTLAHGGLPRDAGALRVPARHNRVRPVEPGDAEPCAGVYAEVLAPGRIRVGDPVRLA